MHARGRSVGSGSDTWRVQREFFFDSSALSVITLSSQFPRFTRPGVGRRMACPGTYIPTK